MSLLLAAAHLSFVGWLLLRPHDVAWVPAPNLRPLATIRTDLALGPVEAARRIGESLLLLAPLGVLLPMAGGRVRDAGPGSFLRTVFAGLMVSMSLEFLQTVVPGQLFDIDALSLNTAGVALAYLAVVPAARRRLRRAAAPDAGHRDAQGRPGGSRGVLGSRGSRGSSRTVTRVGVAP